MLITRRIEFDAGHRIPDHKSKCRNAHGHRYVLEATVEGAIKEHGAGSEQGMVQDFGDLKAILMDAVGEPWDHAFLVWDQDEQMLDALARLGSAHKTVKLPLVPTVENLSMMAFNLILRRLPPDVLLAKIKLWETPNCFAEAV